jgi:hypothetical protein
VDTDDEGRFFLDGLEPGTWLVGTWPGQFIGGLQEVVIAPGEIRVELDLHWTAGR